MKKAGLIKALKAVIPGVAKGDALLTGADSFIFRNGLIQSYNDNLSVTYPMDVGVTGAVKAAELVRILEKMAGDEIQFTEDENSIEITDGTTELSMQFIEFGTEKLLASLALDELDWKTIPDTLVDAFKLCLPSVSRNVSHGGLVGVHTHGNDVMSSDNYRATWVVLAETMEPFTIPGTAIDDLLKLENLEQYAITESWAHFMSREGAVFSSRLIASEFPYEPLKKMFPENVEGKMYQLPDGLDKALDRVDVLAYQQDGGINYVKIGKQKNYLLITGERQFGSVKDKIKLKDGEWPEDISINVLPRYFLEIMKKTKNFQVIGKLVYFQGEKFKHIIATIVVD